MINSDLKMFDNMSNNIVLWRQIVESFYLHTILIINEYMYIVPMTCFYD